METICNVVAAESVPKPFAKALRVIVIHASTVGAETKINTTRCCCVSVRFCVWYMVDGHDDDNGDHNYANGGAHCLLTQSLTGT